MIVRHKIIYENNEEILCVYLDDFNEEFAQEFNSNKEEGEKGLLAKISDYIKDKGIEFNGKVVKVLAGTMLVATMMFTPGLVDNINAEAATTNISYVVESGDNLSTIASRYNTSVTELQQLNNLTTTTIYPGQTLNIGIQQTTNANLYKVVSNDTIGTIASRHNLSTSELKTINNLTSDIISPGTVLLINPQTQVGNYTVKSGDTLWTISKAYGMSWQDIQDLNNNPTQIMPGQTIKVLQARVAQTYTVQSGDSLWTIAQKHNLTVAQLQSMNNLSSTTLQPGQVLNVGGATTTTATVTTPTAAATTYTVRSGDSLWTIARAHNMTVSELQALNNMTTTTLQPGQVLRVSTAAAATPTTTEATYTVRSGDSLWTIARANNMTVSELQALNNMTTTTLQPGQVLRVKGTATTTVTAPTPTTEVKTSSMTVRVRRSSGVVQSVPLEQYVTGVVASELGDGFEVEAYKAQALAARTYVVYETLQGNTVSDTASHQVYKDENQLRSYWGANYDKNMAPIIQAVNATNGEVIKYNGEFINAVFFSTSNGKTETSRTVWGGELPYLQSVESPWDTKSPYYFKENTYSYSEFRSRLGLSSTSTLYAEVTSRTSGGGIGTINIAGRTFTGDNVRIKLGLRSTDYDITFSNGVVTVGQRGWGHRVGLSQYGAHFMAQQGYTYDQIIKHYYQGVDIVQM